MTTPVAPRFTSPSPRVNLDDLQAGRDRVLVRGEFVPYQSHTVESRADGTRVYYLTAGNRTVETTNPTVLRRPIVA